MRHYRHLLTILMVLSILAVFMAALVLLRQATNPCKYTYNEARGELTSIEMSDCILKDVNAFNN